MEKTVKALGEPDDKIVENLGTFKTETWVYARSDRNFVYRFEKSSSSCGGSSDWLLSPIRYYADYHFGYTLYNPPPTITHTPVESSKPSESITIRAQVELHKKVENFPPDEAIIEVNLAYRASGDSLFERVMMSIVDSLYVEDIPSNIVTTAGVDYFIEATSDQSSWHKFSSLPVGSFYTVAVSDTVTVAGKASHPDISGDGLNDNPPVDPGALPGRFSPISP
ncbi:hypothetical protein ACFL6P_02395 [Candidatus Latescibacterota bacterium]